jgi:hypothetical protein
MEAVETMEAVENIQGINKVTWKQKMKSYKRTPLSFLLWLLVNAAMLLTVIVLSLFDRLYIGKRGSIFKCRSVFLLNIPAKMYRCSQQ